MPLIRPLICAAALATLPGLAAAEATATLVDSAGATIGSVSFTESESGVVLITISAEGLTAGVHAIHIHETGDCSAPDFESAGEHLALGHAHGLMAPDGPHPGDLPNLLAGEDGTVAVEFFNDRISLDADAENTVFDDDGSAVVIHAGADDYASQPSGNSGDRIACGVIEAQ
ncbi:MAG: superoxide dismutase family protein [Alphaproteobacteria bacterium]